MEAKTETSSLQFRTEGLRKRNKNHNTALLALIILNCITYVIMIFFNVAAAQPLGIFRNKTGDISNANEVNITPAGATFSTWGVIYTWQTLWLIFNVVLIFLKNDNNRLYYDPPVLTITFHIFIFLNYVFNAAWLALWDAQHFTVSFFFSLFMLLTAASAAFISHKNTVAAEPYLKNRQWVIWLYRMLTNNALTFYAAWLTVATLLNLAIAITYEWAGEDKITEWRNTSSLICLSILTVLLLTYFACDIFFLEKFLRYTFSTYIQFLIAFAGILGKNWNGGKESSSIFSLILAIIVAVMFLTKLAMLLKRLVIYVISKL